MSEFFHYPAVHQVSSDRGPYGDALNHCKQFAYYRVPGNSITSVHECTHGINSQIRNNARNVSRPNGFYLLEDKAIILPEPAGRKSDCIRFIPKAMRYSRFDTYVAGARDWESSPLYIFDEWVAYRNGAVCLLYLNGREGKDTDYLFGPIEFAVYGIATAMANPREDIKAFTLWLLADVLALYQRGRDKFPWAAADKCYAQLQANQEMRNFLGDFRFPGEIPLVPDPPPVARPEVPDPPPVVPPFVFPPGTL
jgi:hypothetical protein